jgi:hypothetical protein
MEDALRRQNQLEDSLADLDTSLVDAVFAGLSDVHIKRIVKQGVEEDWREVAHIPTLRGEGKVSGSAVHAYFRQPSIVSKVVDRIVGNATEVDEKLFLQLRKALQNTDLPNPERDIIGPFWEQVRLQALRNRFRGPGQRVFDQLYISIKGVTERARLDAVVVTDIDPKSRTIRVLLEEDKAVYRPIGNEEALERAQRDVLRAFKETGPGKPNPDLSFELPDDVWEAAGGKGKVTVIIDNFEIERAP